MQNIPTCTVFREITDFLATNPTPKAIIAYRLPDDLQQRAHELLDKMGKANSYQKNGTRCSTTSEPRK